MKKFLLLFVVLILSFSHAEYALANNKHHPRYKKIILMKPVSPHFIVIKPNKMKRGFEWIDGHYNWNKRSSSYIWVKGHIMKRKKVKNGFLPAGRK